MKVSYVLMHRKCSTSGARLSANRYSLFVDACKAYRQIPPAVVFRSSWQLGLSVTLPCDMKNILS